MIIELPGALGRESQRRYKMGFFHFSNNNLAIRKQCAQDLGFYDPQAVKSEDVDLCFRAALSPKWVACRDPGVVVRHKARKTVWGMVRQMWGWGFHLGYAYRKTGRRGVYLYQVCSKEHTIRRHFEVERGPFLVCGFFTDLHGFHLFAAAALAGFLAGYPVVGWGAGVLAAFCMHRHLHSLRNTGLNSLRLCKLAMTHYLANWSFGLATFMGALRYRMVLLPSTIFPPRSTEPR